MLTLFVAYLLLKHNRVVWSRTKISALPYQKLKNVAVSFSVVTDFHPYLRETKNFMGCVFPL